jgi:hypothetical protein
LARMPPAAPDPIITKSTSSDVLYLGCSGFMIWFWPRPPDLAASLDSPCRNIQTAVGTCARHRGQSLSSPRHPDCRVYRNRGQSENRNGVSAPCFKKECAAARPMVEIAAAICSSRARGHYLAVREWPRKTSPPGNICALPCSSGPLAKSSGCPSQSDECGLNTTPACRRWCIGRGNDAGGAASTPPSGRTQRGATDFAA